MKLLENKKNAVIIVIILIVISVGIVVARYFLPKDIFVPSYQSDNSSKLVPYDTTQKFKNPGIQLLIPAGFDVSFVPVSGTYVGILKNGDIALEIRVKNSLSSPFLSASGGDPRGSVYTIQSSITRTSNPVTQVNNVSRLYRETLLSDEKTIQYLWVETSEQTDTEKFGYSYIPLFDISSKPTTISINMLISINKNDITENQLNSYLQLADKVLLSIQPND